MEHIKNNISLLHKELGLPYSSAKRFTGSVARSFKEYGEDVMVAEHNDDSFYIPVHEWKFIQQMVEKLGIKAFRLGYEETYTGNYPSKTLESYKLTIYYAS